MLSDLQKKNNSKGFVSSAACSAGCGFARSNKTKQYLFASYIRRIHSKTFSPGTLKPFEVFTLLALGSFQLGYLHQEQHKFLSRNRRLHKQRIGACRGPKIRTEEAKKIPKATENFQALLRDAYCSSIYRLNLALSPY